MAVRATDYAAAEHLDDLAHLAACLKADPQATALVPDVEAGFVALRTQSEEWDLNRHVVQETQKGLGNVSESLCNVVRAAHAMILDDLGYNRRSPRFLTYFPRGLVAYTRASYLDQLTAVRSLALRCAQDPNPRIQDQAGRLQAAADQMDAAFARRAKALVAEAASFGQLQVEKLATIEICRRVGHRLTELYPYQRDRVRSYFRKIYRRPRPKLTIAGEPTPEAAADDASAGSTAAARLAAEQRVVKTVPAWPTLVRASAAARLPRTVPREMRSTTNYAGPDDFSLGSDVRGNPMTSLALGSAGWDDVFPGRPAICPAGETWGFRERPPFPSG